MSKYEFHHHISGLRLKSSSLFPEICISRWLRVWQSRRNGPFLRLASVVADVPRVVIVQDALCSSSDTGHDALMAMYRTRFSEQIDLVSAGELFDLWRPD